jgi:hypothetical protein
MIAIGVGSCVFVDLFPGEKFVVIVGDMLDEKRTSARKNPPNGGFFYKDFKRPRKGTLNRLPLSNNSGVLSMWQTWHNLQYTSRCP